MASEKMVGKKDGTAPASREESFGSKPPHIGLSKGADMATFGYKTGDSIWPTREESVNSKTGFPRGYDGGKK